MAWVHRLQGLLGGKHVGCKVVVVGLPGCGKSLFMTQIKPPDSPLIKLTHTLPVEFKAEEFNSKAITFLAFDIGMETEGFGNPWQHNYEDCDALIFIIDTSDQYNVPLVKEQLEHVFMTHTFHKRDIPVLFLANKCDQFGAMGRIQLQQKCEISKFLLGKSKWTVVNTDMLTGEGLNEAFDWLAHQLRRTLRKDLY